MRAIAMESTDGLRRGMKVNALGSPISIPTGEQIKGRMLNVVGAPIDGMHDFSRENVAQYTESLLSLKIFLPQKGFLHRYQSY